MMRAVSQEKWLGHKADHSPSTNTEAKNEQSYISPHLMCLDGTYRDNFTFIFVNVRYTG
jgi:hypothetical protein